MKKLIVVIMMLVLTMILLSGCGKNIKGEYTDMFGEQSLTVTDEKFYFDTYEEYTGTYEINGDIVYVDCGEYGAEKYKITKRYGVKALQVSNGDEFNDNNIYSYYVKTEDYEKFRNKAIEDFPELNK